MELNDAIKTLVEAMRNINAKIDNRYLSIEFVLFEANDFKIRTYAGKYGTSFNDEYKLNEEGINIAEDDLINGLKQGVNNAKARIKEKIQEHGAIIEKLKSEMKELDAAMGEED